MPEQKKKKKGNTIIKKRKLKYFAKSGNSKIGNHKAHKTQKKIVKKYEQ